MKMEKMTKTQVLDKFKEYIETDYDLSTEIAFSYINDNVRDQLTSILGKFTYKLKNVRSSDGDHDECETVIYFEEHDVYLSICGYYNSHEGSNYDEGEWDIVYPKQVTKTIYTTTES